MGHVGQPRLAVAGRRILITGASSGIGLASARALAAQGARLTLVARGGEALETDALAGPVGSAEVDGGLPARPSVLRRLRDRTLSS